MRILPSPKLGIRSVGASPSGTEPCSINRSTFSKKYFGIFVGNRGVDRVQGRDCAIFGPGVRATQHAFWAVAQAQMPKQRFAAIGVAGQADSLARVTRVRRFGGLERWGWARRRRRLGSIFGSRGRLGITGTFCRVCRKAATFRIWAPVSGPPCAISQAGMTVPGRPFEMVSITAASALAIKASLRSVGPMLPSPLIPWQEVQCFQK